MFQLVILLNSYIRKKTLICPQSIYLSILTKHSFLGVSSVQSPGCGAVLPRCSAPVLPAVVYQQRETSEFSPTYQSHPGGPGSLRHVAVRHPAGPFSPPTDRAAKLRTFYWNIKVCKSGLKVVWLRVKEEGRTVPSSFLPPPPPFRSSHFNLLSSAERRRRRRAAPGLSSPLPADISTVSG